MKWWYYSIGSNVFFTIVGTLSAKWFPTPRQQWILQLLLLPVLYVVNVWYGYSSALAVRSNVSYVFFIMLSAVVGAFLSVLGSAFILHQPFSWGRGFGVILILMGMFFIIRG